MYRRVRSNEIRAILRANDHDRYPLRRMYATLRSAKTKEYEGRKLVGFSMEQIFTVVADVGNYKYFLPFCKKSDVVSARQDFLKAELVIGFPPVTESYTSMVRIVRPRLVRAECTDGKLFNHLNTLWIFSEGLKNNAQTCVIDFSLSFEFRSVIHSHLSNLVFNEIVRQMENAFLQEATRSLVLNDRLSKELDHLVISHLNIYDCFMSLNVQRCLLLVNFDVDAMCACKILQQLLKNDNVLYTLVPVQGIQDMIRAFQEIRHEVKNVVMINCGGTVDLVELLEPAEGTTLYVVDSHRPYDLCNVYSESQICILGKPDADGDIPDYNDVFRDDSSDEENSVDGAEDESESRRAKRRRLNEEDIAKRIERREWTKKRDTIVFNYSQYSYYSRSSAVVVFEMAWNMCKDNLDMAWWAIVGSTERAILNKVEPRVSILEEGNLQAHVSRLTHRQGTTGDDTSTDGQQQYQQTAVRVTYDKDLQLALYRHWTVEASLKHSMPTAVSLRLWSIKGEKRLRELLAEMGLPLAQSKQRFCAMDLTIRQEFREMVEKLAGKYNVDKVIGTSFTLQHGYRFKYCASDVVYAMLALLESSTKEKSPERCFSDALDCLSRMKKDSLEDGIEKAKCMLNNVFKTAQGILEMRQVLNAGTFLYIIVPDGNLDSRLFAHPHPLTMLAQFALRAYVNSSRNRRASEWPLLASATYNIEEGTCLVVGIPPVCEDQPRSLFGKAFEEAAKNTNCYMEADYFDSTVIRLKVEERPKFFDALAALLT